MAATVNFPCSTCGEILQLELAGVAAETSCQRCGTAARLAHAADGTPQRCAACGGEALYVQRDFNRKLGLGIVIVAAALMVQTRGISLLVAVLIDLLLYRLLPRITVCYACDAVHRGVPVHSAHLGFDHHVAEEFKVERSRRQASVREWRLAQPGASSGKPGREKRRHDTESRKRSSISGG